jgi:hypothetical protein
MNGYVIVICVMLIMFAGLAIVIVQADVDERRFQAEHLVDEELDQEGIEPIDPHPDLSAAMLVELPPEDADLTGAEQEVHEDLSA